MPDAIVLLKDDHKTVEQLFKQFEKLQKSDVKPSAKGQVVDDDPLRAGRAMFSKIREAMGRNDLQGLGDVMEQANSASPTQMARPRQHARRGT